MSYFLKQTIDFDRHNEEVGRVWKAYGEGRPYRVPTVVNGSITNYFNNPELKFRGLTLSSSSPIHRCRSTRSSTIRGTSDSTGFVTRRWACRRMSNMSVDFQNSYEAGSISCPLKYDGLVPDTVEILAGDDKMKLYELNRQIPVRGNLLDHGRVPGIHAGRCRSLEYEEPARARRPRHPRRRNRRPVHARLQATQLTACLMDMMTDGKFPRP